MTTILVILMIVLSFIMMIGKVSASLSGFAIAQGYRGYIDDMPDEHRKITARSFVIHSINDFAQAAFFFSLITFLISKVKTLYGDYTKVYEITDLLIIISFFISLIYVWGFKIKKRIADIREKWKKQKRFGPEHDQEVNYCHSMEWVVEDIGLNMLMGIIINCIMLFG